MIFVVGFKQAHYSSIPQSIWDSSPEASFVDVRNDPPHGPSTRRSKDEALVDNIARQDGFVSAVVACVEAGLKFSRIFVGLHP